MNKKARAVVVAHSKTSSAVVRVVDEAFSEPLEVVYRQR